MSTTEQLIGGALCILFVILLARFVRHWPVMWTRIRSRRSESWPSVEATVTSCEVQKCNGHGELYRPRLTFSYFLDGEQHGRFAGDFYGSREEAQLALSEICQQHPLMVRVHPTKPGNCILALPQH